jgi:serine/threonine protein kinase
MYRLCAPVRARIRPKDFCMPAPATTSEFIDLVQKSGIVDPSRLAPYVQQILDRGPLPKLPSVMANFMVRDAIVTLFQAEQLLLGKWKRFTIGKYKVLERIGSGGMGQVFLCEHKMMRRRVAIKVLPTAKAEDEASLERFYREARAVATLDHPNLVRAFDIDQEESLHFLVMEFIDGTNLHDIVKRSGPLSPLRACHYIYQSAFGLQYAFDCAGLVHRDIKPGNILVDRSGVVKILDMGLARFFYDEEDPLTRKYDETLGTADYLAPEQALDSHCVDIRADIYSLGATFYFLLTGSPPFPEGTVAQKLMWHQSKQPAAIRTLRPEVPPEIATLIERMMMKKPAERLASPAHLIEALEPFVQTPIDPPTETELPQLSPAARAGLNATSASSGRPQIPRPAPVAAAKLRPAPAAPSPAPKPSAPANVPKAFANKPATAPAAVATAPGNRLAPAYNPYSRLADAVGSGPLPQQQIYVTAALRAEHARLPVASPTPTTTTTTTKSRWLAPAIAFIVVLTVGGFFLRQLGIVPSPKAPSQSGDAALVQPN